MSNNNLIFKSQTNPSIEIYDEYFIIKQKKFYYSEIFKIYFLKGRHNWLFTLFIFFLVFLTSSYEQDVTDGVNELKIYLKNKKGGSRESLMYKVKDQKKEMSFVIDLINSKIKQI
jgi:hypothetical protein